MFRVVLKDVTKIYPGDVLAVKDATLQVADKEFVVLVGPSGCGKSTILRMIAGLEEVTSGDIYIDDVRINDVPPKDRDIAMVFQNYALYPHMTVYNNMAFGLKLRKYSRSEIQRRVKEAAEILGITRLLDRKPKALSGGERQRLAIARAILKDPDILIFDEATSNVDTVTEREIQKALEALTRGRTTLAIAHRLSTLRNADRIVVFEEGHVAEIGTHEELMAKQGLYHKMVSIQTQLTKDKESVDDIRALAREETEGK